MPELGIEFIDLVTNFDWRCDIYKYVDCGDSSALWSSGNLNAIPGFLDFSVGVVVSEGGCGRYMRNRSSCEGLV